MIYFKIITKKFKHENPSVKITNKDRLRRRRQCTRNNVEKFLRFSAYTPILLFRVLLRVRVSKFVTEIFRMSKNIFD